MATEGFIKYNILSEKDFGRLFEECRPLFVRIANSYVHDSQIAEDITDDSFIKLWEKREELLTENYEAYAFRSVINKCLDHLKVLQAQTRIRQDIHESGNRMQMYEINSLKNCDPDRLFAGEIEKLIKECLDSMPGLTKQVFIASRYRGKTYGEIAMEMDIPVRQVTAHMQYALKALRLALKDYLVILTFLLYLKGLK